MFKKKEKVRLGVSVYYYREKKRLTLVISNCHTNNEMLGKLVQIGLDHVCKATVYPKSLTEKTIQIEYEGIKLEWVEKDIINIFKEV